MEQDLLANFGKTNSCPTAADYQTTCDAAGEDNFFTDPLYDSMQWVYDMINVVPVWEMGLTGANVHVRVNDDGGKPECCLVALLGKKRRLTLPCHIFSTVDAQHPEFANRFDLENSCDVFSPSIDSESGKLGDHGTACASLILAESNNDQCAVGIAPGATVSSCVLVGDEANQAEEGARLSHNLEVVDVSSNSWGPLPVSLLLM